MDVNMPELDGFDLAAMIRQHPRCQKIAIIFVSAVHFTDRDRLRGYESGAVDYVSVPVSNPQILRGEDRCLPRPLPQVGGIGAAEPFARASGDRADR